MFQDDAQLEAAVKAALEDIYTTHRDTIVEMLKPQYHSCNAGERSLTLRYEMQPWQRNGGGIMHGGITAAILDQTMGTFVRSVTPKELRVVTAEMSVSYLRQILPGEQIESKATIISRGRSMIRLRAEITAQSSRKLSATATAVFAVSPRRENDPARRERPE